MRNTGNLKLVTRGEREIVMTREFNAPRRLLFDAFTKPEMVDEAWYPGEAVGTIVLSEQSGKTTVTQTILYGSREARDAILKTGMEKGLAASYERLADTLASVRTGGMEKGASPS